MDGPSPTHTHTQATMSFLFKALDVKALDTSTSLRPKGAHAATTDMASSPAFPGIRTPAEAGM